MKAISLIEPYATLIKNNQKKIETRSWKTTYRGELLIHASKTKTPKEWQNNKELMNLLDAPISSYGQIVCKCKLVDCIKMTKEYIDKIKVEKPIEYFCGIYKEGRYAWVLEDIKPITPSLYAKGNLNIWEWSKEKQLEDILRKSNKIMTILEVLQNYSQKNPSFKNYYLAAGAINQTVFNYFHNNPLDKNIGDFDIVYYDENTSYEKEDEIIKDLEKTLQNLKVKLDIKNEYRVPIWLKENYNREILPYKSVEDAISRWGTTVTCIGVRLENNNFKIYSPYGLDDLFSLTIRPVKIDFNEMDYMKKTEKWRAKWPKLTIIPWNVSNESSKE